MSDEKTGKLDKGDIILFGILAIMFVALVAILGSMAWDRISPNEEKTITIDKVTVINGMYGTLGVIDTNCNYYVVRDGGTKMFVEEGKTLTVEVENYPGTNFVFYVVGGQDAEIIRVISPC
jgi:hypothetical protein